MPVTMMRVRDFMHVCLLAWGQFGHFPQAQCTVSLWLALRTEPRDSQMISKCTTTPDLTLETHASESPQICLNWAYKCALSYLDFSTCFLSKKVIVIIKHLWNTYIMFVVGIKILLLEMSHEEAGDRISHCIFFYSL